MDYNFINSRLATGAHIADGNDAGILAAAGITHIIDCTDEGDDTPLFVPYGQVHVLFNPTADDGTHKDPQWFKASLDFALSTFAQPGTKIYAHCSSGINRGPSTAYAILRALGFDPATAEQMIRAVRPQVGLAYKLDADAAIQALGYRRSDTRSLGSQQAKRTALLFARKSGACLGLSLRSRAVASQA